MSEKKKLTFADIKKRKKPSVKRVPIAMDSEEADEFNRLRVRVEDAKQQAQLRSRDKEAQVEYESLKAELEEFEEKIEDDIVVFTFRSIGRNKFDEVLEACPPTDAQVRKAKKEGDDVPNWNEDTFPPALMSEAIVEPELSEEDIFEIWESPDWSHAEVASLFLAALEVNQSRSVVELGKESG